MFFSEQINKAIDFAAVAHRRQSRKSSDELPYLSHLFNVTMILERAGADDETIIAGILHDVVEDTEYTPADIEENFGAEVRRLVEGVTDDMTVPFPERRRKLLQYLEVADPRIKIIKVADVLHNAYSKTQLLKKDETLIRKYFRHDKITAISQYEDFVAAIGHGWDHPLVHELERVIEIFRQVAEGRLYEGTRVDYTNMKLAPVINCLVTYQGKILLVQRSETLNFYPGLWNGISGFLDDSKSPRQKAYEELAEELSIKAESVVEMKVGASFRVSDDTMDKIWDVHPILVEIDSDEIHLDREAQAYDWFTPAQALAKGLVPGFDRVIKSFFNQDI
ncbi:MAG: HD domain-containing protein [Candidatus Komeilibacteria bacterium]|nr:HD domain-containing protein [Candidatus Komeilibacteria bacterium]